MPCAGRQGAGKPLLAPRLVDHDGHGVRQVEAAIPGSHGDAEASLDGELVEVGGSEAGPLGAEHEHVVEAERGLVDGPVCGRREAVVRTRSGVGQFAEQHAEALVDVDVGELVVIEPGPAEEPVVEVEAQGFDEVERRADVGAQPNDVARVGRNLGSDQHDVHRPSLLYPDWVTSSRLRNWAGNLQFGAHQIVEPASVDEVQRAVAGAAAGGCRIHAVGTAHSFSDVADSDGLLLSTKHLNRIHGLGYGGNTHQVSIEPGVRYGELGTYLHSERRSLANLASLPHVSVGGAVATATHGSGDHNGSLACAVRSIDLMLSTGDIVSFDRSHPHFDGIVVGLGALGVVVGLSLHTEPTFDVAQTVHVGLPLEAGLAHFDAIMGSAYSVSWFTRWLDGVVDQVWSKSVVTGVSVRDGLREGLDFCQFGAARAQVPMHPVPGADEGACTEQFGVAGPWHERLPHFRLAHTPSSGDELQTELFVDRVVVADAARALAEIGPRIASALQVSEVRTIAADHLWLSPAYERDVVGFHFTWRSDWGVTRPALAAVERALEPFEPVPHWAKVTGLSAAAVRSRLPGFDRFAALLAIYDPDRVFANPFLDRLMTT